MVLAEGKQVPLVILDSIRFREFDYKLCNHYCKNDENMRVYDKDNVCEQM